MEWTYGFINDHNEHLVDSVEVRAKILAKMQKILRFS